MRAKKQNSKDLAYEYIRSRIINGEYAANEKIDDALIAEELNISKTPIRDAIQILVSQNFLKSSSKVGTTVTEVNIDNIYQLYEPLAKLQGIAAKSACLAAKKSDIEHLKDINNKLGEAIEQKDNIRIMSLDKEFHGYILQLANNPFITRFSDELLMQIQRIEYLFLDNIISIPNSVKEHEDLIKAFKKKDDALCEKLMEDNWLNTIPDMNIKTLSRLISALK